MADPTQVRAGLIAKLEASDDLMDAFPDGVWFGVAPREMTKFILVSTVIAEDERFFNATDGDLRFLFLVKAVEKTEDSTNVDAGAVLIHAALQDQPLTITGYTHQSTKREEHIEYPEVDDDTDERWQHSGGRYEVVVSANG